MNTATILVVDDDDRLRLRLLQALRDRALEVEGAGSMAEALRRALPRGGAVEIMDGLGHYSTAARVLADLAAAQTHFVDPVWLSSIPAIAHVIDQEEIGRAWCRERV